MLPGGQFYETPAPFTRWLFEEVPIRGHVYEPCVGAGAIPAAAPDSLLWTTNDLDPHWPADTHEDAATPAAWAECDWTVTNPPFSLAIEILTLALEHSRIGVAMHLRASMHEVLKTGPRRTWMAEHPPTGILWLPRFAYQRSPTTGKWTTDSMGACWVVWRKGAGQFIRYAPERVLDELDRETPGHRARMDRLMKGA